MRVVTTHRPVQIFDSAKAMKLKVLDALCLDFIAPRSLSLLNRAYVWGCSASDEGPLRIGSSLRRAYVSLVRLTADMQEMVAGGKNAYPVFNRQGARA